VKKLKAGFYQRSDTLTIARELLGKILVTNWPEGLTSGRIVETEAYLGAIDKASHAFGNRLTNRTKVMFQPGGVAYIYLCYGIHHLFNIVTGVDDTPHVVLIRALEPIAGSDIMSNRTGIAAADPRIAAGPGKLTKALGLTTRHSGYSLTGDEIFLTDDGVRIKENEIIASKRIGVDYAGDDALLPYRFTIPGHPSVSVKQRLL
jgi:DNA-3-methyladenine glycosylase